MHSNRGLRQGGLISPFIFSVVAEAFNAMLSKAFLGGMVEGFEVGRNGMMVAHLQFANETLNMCKSPVKHLKFLRCVIRCFEVVSGLKINLSKSCIYGMG